MVPPRSALRKSSAPDFLGDDPLVIELNQKDRGKDCQMLDHWVAELLLALALLEHRDQRAEPDRHADDPESIAAPQPLELHRLGFQPVPNRPHHRQTGQQIDVKNPPPARPP
jgi:hypothetical protein